MRGGMTFFERQRMVSSVGVWIGIGIAVIASAAMPFFLMEAAGDGAATTGTIVGAVSLLSLLLFFVAVRLDTRVDAKGVHVQVAPLMRTRTIPFHEIARCWARSYRPIREYGGWGIRGLGRNRAYNIKGSDGVQLVLTDGRRILIGSQRAAQLSVSIVDGAWAAGSAVAGETSS